MRPLDCLCIQLSMFIYIFLTQFSVFTYVYRMLRSMCIIIVITVHIIELLCWWRSSCTDFIRAEMLIGRLVGSPAWVSGWLVVGGGVQVVRWAVAPFFFLYYFWFWTRQPSRAGAKPKPNRVPFDKRGLLRSAKLCQMCPSCTCYYLSSPGCPLAAISITFDHLTNNRATVGVISPLATDRECSVSDMSSF